MVRFFKQGLNLTREEFSALGIGFFLDDSAECDLQATGEVEFQTSLDDPGNTSLSGLRIDPDDCLVRPTDILRIKGQVGQFPRIFGAATFLLSELEPLFD